MSELVITPEISLQLQSAVNTTGFTKGELLQLLRPEVLEQLLPLFTQQAKITPAHTIPVWREIEISPEILTGRDFVTALEGIGVRDNFFSYDSIRGQLQVGVSAPLVYELFKVKPLDFGINETLPYSKVVRRAGLLGLHDDTAPPALIAELLLQGFIASQKEPFRCRVHTKSVLNTFFGKETEYAFALGNGFRPEDPSNTTLKESDVIFLANWGGEKEDTVTPGDEIIFARKKAAHSGGRKIPSRAGEWPTPPLDGKLLTLD